MAFLSPLSTLAFAYARQPQRRSLYDGIRAALASIRYIAGFGPHPQRAEWDLAGERVIRAAIDLIEYDERTQRTPLP